MEHFVKNSIVENLLAQLKYQQLEIIQFMVGMVFVDTQNHITMMAYMH